MRFLFLFLIFCYSLSAKIYDCFTFYNEIDILQMRFAELNEHVDYFVLVESKDTFSGLKKPLYFQENQALFQKYRDKIIHVIVEKTPEYEEDAWARESFQRNQIMRGLASCSKEDVILISDVDEIPKGSRIGEMITLLDSKERQIIACSGDFYRWFLNKKDPRQWVGPAVIKYKNLMKRSPQNVREQRTKYVVLTKSAWHFSNMGGYRTFLDKMKAYSHFKESSGLLTLSAKDIYDIFSSLKTVELDETFPRFILENYEEFDRKNFFDRGFYE